MTEQFQLFPLLSAEEYASLKEDIAQRGVLIPLEIDQDGELLDGFNRRQICTDLGIEPPTVTRIFDSPEARLAHVIAVNLKRRHLNESQRAMVGARVASMPQGARTDIAQICAMSQLEAADLLGVSRRSVQSAKAVQEQAEPEVVTLVEQGKMTVAAAAKLAKKQPRKQRTTAAKVRASKTRSEATTHVAQATGETEWFTPPEYIEAACLVMGGIDLDPASCEEAKQIVRADTFYSSQDDGLAQRWFGRVWLNPPYSQPLIVQFADKLVASFNAGDVKQACVLVNNATETAWFQLMLKASSAICFIRGRVRFLNAEGENTGAPLQGQAVLYFGNKAAAFQDAFRDFGLTTMAAWE